MSKTSPKKEPTYKQLPIQSIIIPKLTMRGNLTEASITELADNIRQNGLLHPLTVTPHGEKYLLIAGHRRYFALRRLKAKQAPCFVRNADPQMVETLKCAENYSRSELPPIAESHYLNNVKATFNLTDAALAKLVGRSQSYVSEHLAAAHYDPAIQAAITAGRMTFSIARELHRITDDKVRAAYTGYAREQGITDETARAWREDWQMREAQLANGQAPPKGRTDATPVPQPTVNCDACLKPVAFHETRLVRICDGCYTAAK